MFNFNWVETMESYETVVSLSPFHNATVIDLRGEEE